MFFKLCGLTRAEDVRLAASLGFALAGFIFHPKSPRYVDPAPVATFADPAISGNLVRTGVFVEKDSCAIAAIARQANVDLLQLHGDQDRDCLRTLAGEFGRQRLVRVLWPERFVSLETGVFEKARFEDVLGEAAEQCSTVLLDAGQGGGGHGRGLALHDLQDIAFPCPWILAGGLDEQSLDAVVAAGLKPAGLDFNSRLERAPGVKDHDRMRCLVARARELGLGPSPWTHGNFVG